MSWESICEGRKKSHIEPVEYWYNQEDGEIFTNFVCETPYNLETMAYDISEDWRNDRKTPHAVGKSIHALIPASRAPSDARRKDGDVRFKPQLAKVLKKEAPLNLYSLLFLTFCMVVSTFMIYSVPRITVIRPGGSEVSHSKKL